MEARKTLTQRVKDLEFLLGRLLSKMDQVELSTGVKEDEFGAPQRAGKPWTDKEKLSLSKAFLIFIETRAVYHKRTVDAILARIEHERWLHEAELREDIKVYERNQSVKGTHAG